MEDEEEESSEEEELSNGSHEVRYTYEKRVRVWCFIKEHGLDEEIQTLTEERKAQDV